MSCWACCSQALAGGAEWPRRMVRVVSSSAPAVFVKPYALILVPWLLFAAGISGLVAFAVDVRGRIAAAGHGVRLVGQPGTDPRRYRNRHRHNRAEPARARERLGGDGGPSGSGPVHSIVARRPPPSQSCSSLRPPLDLAASLPQPAYLEFGVLSCCWCRSLSPQGWDYVLLLATPAAVLLIDRFAKWVGCADRHGDGPRIHELHDLRPAGDARCTPG